MNLITILRRRIMTLAIKYHQNELECSNHNCNVCFESNYVKWMRNDLIRDEYSVLPEEIGLISPWVGLLYDRDSVSPQTQLEHSWSKRDKSLNVCVLPEDPFSLLREPEPHSTDGIRGKVGYSKGLHMWKITWPEDQRGTHASIGVSTKNFHLQRDFYTSLVGIDEESWGWDIANLLRWHNNSHSLYPCKQYRRLIRKPYSKVPIKVPSELTMILDMDRGVLMFISNNKFLGVAHTGLKGKTVYVTIGSVWGKCQVTMKYHGSIKDNPPCLQEIALYKVKKLVHSHCNYNDQIIRKWRLNADSYINTDSNANVFVNKLNLPETIKCQINKSVTKPKLF